MRTFRMNSLGSIEELEYEEELTLRDYFAAKAMQALISSSKITLKELFENGWDIKYGNPFIAAYNTADLMMKAREQ